MKQLFTISVRSWHIGSVGTFIVEAGSIEAAIAIVRQKTMAEADITQVDLLDGCQLLQEGPR